MKSISLLSGYIFLILATITGIASNGILKTTEVNLGFFVDFISGNFINQPSFKLFKFKANRNTLKNSQKIEDRGFFIGLGNKRIDNKTLNFLAKNLLRISSI